MNDSLASRRNRTRLRNKLRAVFGPHVETHSFLIDLLVYCMFQIKFGLDRSSSEFYLPLYWLIRVHGQTGCRFVETLFPSMRTSTAADYALLCRDKVLGVGNGDLDPTLQLLWLLGYCRLLSSQCGLPVHAEFALSIPIFAFAKETILLGASEVFSSAVGRLGRVMGRALLLDLWSLKLGHVRMH